MDSSFASRRDILAGVVAGTAVAATATLGASPAAADVSVGGIAAVPELAPQWKKLDLAEILKRPAAFKSVSQIKSVYEPWGAQAGEKHFERGSLPATVKAAEAARKAGNFHSFNWVGYSIFREDYPQSDFDRVQYSSWVEGNDFSPEMRDKDNELASELQALVQPGDNEYKEMALQTAFFGTILPLELARKRIEVIVLTGIHLDWCIEGNARVARDNGYLPIVIGDACGCQKPEQEAAAMERINNFFAPVISSAKFVELLESGA